MIIPIFFSAIVTVSIYAGFYATLDYYAAYEWGVESLLSSTANSAILMALFVFVFFLFYRFHKKIIILTVLTLCVVVIGSASYLHYRAERARRGDDPNIHEVSQAGGIQAEVITISGLRFAPPYEQGMVFIGDEQMTVKKWTRNQIVAEHPVTKKKGTVQLYIKRADGRISNSVGYELRDPSY